MELAHLLLISFPLTKFWFIGLSHMNRFFQNKNKRLSVLNCNHCSLLSLMAWFLHVFETFRMFTEVCVTVLKLHNESNFHNPSWFISTVDVLCHILMMSHNSQNKKTQVTIGITVMPDASNKNKRVPNLFLVFVQQRKQISPITKWLSGYLNYQVQALMRPACCCCCDAEE